MPRNIRIRTKIGVDKEVKVNLDQDFDRLEILSLNLHQSDTYRRDCADFGVIAGRVVTNGGFGVPNAKVAVFVPLDNEDESNPVISQLYPYKRTSFRNEEGYSYNLLSSTPNYEGHKATGTFPTRREVLLNQDVEYVYKKYYKFTVKTNPSGDYMLYGIPPGNQTLIMNLDLSDMGCFSLTPEDLKRMGKPEAQFDGADFMSGTTLETLPQIVSQAKVIEVRPFWGDDEACNAAITRVDFDLRDSSIEIKPVAVFMGSSASDDGKNSVNKNCIPRRRQGNLCELVTGPGDIESIRHTIAYTTGGTINAPQVTPILQRKDYPGALDGDGAFLINVPMNMDYVYTNEFGEQVLSPDPKVGIPTKSKSRFRIKFSQDGSGFRLRKRGEYLLPNIKEYNAIPADAGENVVNGNITIEEASYSFSTDIENYASKYDVLATNDYFYTFRYNRVYTPSLYLHKHRDSINILGFIPFGNNKHRFVGIKSIKPDPKDACTDIVTEFPANDAYRDTNLMFIIAQLMFIFMQIIFIVLFLYLGYITISWLLAFAAGIGSEVYFGTLLGGIMAYAINSIARGFDVNLPLTKYSECESCDCGGAPFFDFNLAAFSMSYSASDVSMPSVDSSFVGSSVQGQSSQLGGTVAGSTTPPVGVTAPTNAEGNCADLVHLPGGNCGACAGGLAPAYYSDGCYQLSFGNYAVINIAGNAINGTIVAITVALALYIFLCIVGTVGSFGTAGPIICQGLNFIVGLVTILLYIAIITLFAGFLIAIFTGTGGCNSIVHLSSFWRARKTVYQALCGGIINQIFANNWIHGFLYHFQFKAKTITDAQAASLNWIPFGWAPQAGTKFCESVVYLSDKQKKYYYRSSKWAPGANYPQGTFNKLRFSTTVSEIGLTKGYLLDTCNDLSICDDCYVLPKMGSTSAQDNDDLLEYVANSRYQYEIEQNNNPYFLGNVTINNLFFNVRNFKKVDGDIAQALSQNNEFGIAQFVSPDEPGNSLSNPGSLTNFEVALTNPYYFELLDSSQCQTPNSVGFTGPEGTIDTNGGVVTIPFAVEGPETRDCLLGKADGFDWSQDTYWGHWSTAGGAGGWGNRGNDYSLTSGDGVQAPGGITQFVSQPGYQYSPNTLPPIGPTTADDMRIARHFHYYFGHKVGFTSYNLFEEKYINKPEDDLDLTTL